MDKRWEGTVTMVEVKKRLQRAMEARQSGGEGPLALSPLKKVLNDADYWRKKYDELLIHLEHQNDYRRFLERQVFGGPSF